MRLARGLVIASLLSASLIGAAFATAARVPGEDGTLTVRDGRGTMVVRFRGSIIGRLGNGTLTVTDADGGATAVVRGWERRRFVGATTTVYVGTNMRFRIAHDRRILVRLGGRGLNLSVVGRGDGWMDGSGDPAAGIFFDGSYSLNGDPYHSLPDERTPFELVLPPPPPRPSSGEPRRA